MMVLQVSDLQTLLLLRGNNALDAVSGIGAEGRKQRGLQDLENIAATAACCSRQPRAVPGCQLYSEELVLISKTAPNDPPEA